MATINRFNKFTPRSYDMEWYAPEVFTPNLEGWDQLLGMHQAKYDAAVAATQKYPKHLENRIDLAGQYRQGTENAVNDITQSYVSNGVTAGNRKMRDFGMQLNKDWQPGGLAYELEQEYTDYQNALTGIDKYYKDQKAENSANRLYSLDKLKQASSGEFKQDKTTGMYQRANITPSLHPYVDIADESLKLVKEIKENGRTDIISMSPAWFQKIQTEEVTPETIKEVTQALLQQPKYAEQRSIELWREKSKYTPEQLAQLEQDTKQSYIDNFNSQLVEIDKNLGDKKKAADFQRVLKEEGYYDGKIDGNFGKDSKEALAKYKSDVKTKLDETIAGTTSDSILNKQINDSYTRPLVAAFARKKVEKELIFNKQWEVTSKISAQRENTGALVSAIQSLKPVPQSEFLQSPGLSRPMDTLDELKSQSQKVYDDSKKSFNDIANLSGITGILGTTAPNKIHDVTNARLSSANPKEFQKALQDAGISGDPQKLWDYFNSPGADALKDSYISMQQAKGDLEGGIKAQADMFKSFFDTPEGKKSLRSIKAENSFLTNESPEQIAQMLANDDNRFNTVTPNTLAPMGMVSSTGFGSSIPNKRDVVKDTKERINNEMKKNPNAFPASMRGTATTAIKGPALDLKNAIIEDFKSGYTLGYTSGGVEGVTFKTIEENGKGTKVPLNQVDLDGSNLRFNADAKSVTYYMTGKQLGKDGKPVVMVAEAPKEHYDRLRQMSLEMLRQAEQSGDEDGKQQAMNIYAVTTSGPRIQNAVDDQIVLNSKNSRKLYDVIDPNVKGRIQTFGNNEDIIGKPIGSEKESNGLVYQKFKIANPKTGAQSYMQTVKTNSGYMPIKNESGGLYYNNSSAADAPILMGEMMRQIPVQINNQKVYSPNLTEAETQMLMLSVEQADSENNNL